MQRVLVTGAAGRIGSVLREGLRGEFDLLRLADVRELGRRAPGEELVKVDLDDFDRVLELVTGIDAVVHLAAIPTEDRFERLLRENVAATYNVFEAARRRGVRRVVFASTNHVTGFYPRDRRVRPDDPVRPDTLYAVTKVFGEAIGRLYADKFGLDVVCLRIGAFGERPTSERELALWLSHRDAVHLVERALAAPDVGFLVVYGVSRNRGSWYDDANAARLGYRPEDDAFEAAPELAVEKHAGELQGGRYADPDFGSQQ